MDNIPPRLGDGVDICGSARFTNFTAVVGDKAVTFQALDGLKNLANVHRPCVLGDVLKVMTQLPNTAGMVSQQAEQGKFY